VHETSHNCRGRNTDYRRLTPGGRHDRHPLVTLLQITVSQLLHKIDRLKRTMYMTRDSVAVKK